MKCCAETDSIQLTAVTGTDGVQTFITRKKEPTLMEMFTATGKLKKFF